MTSQPTASARLRAGFSALWEWISNQGLQDVTDPDQLKQSRLLNQTASVLFLASTPNAVPLLQAGNTPLAGGYLVAGFFHLIAILLSRAGHRRLAPHFTLMGLCLGTTSVALVMGPEANVQAGLMLVPGAAHMVLRGRPQALVLWVLPPILCWWGLTVVWQTGLVSQMHDEDLAWTTAWIVLPCMLAISAILTGIFTREREQAEAKLQQASEQAQAATVAKSRFLATMSHEIRTPLAGVLGLTELLSHERLEPAHMEMLGAIQESGKALQVIIDDLLDFSKLEAGQMSLESTAFDLRHMIGSCVRLSMGQAKSKGLRTIVKLSPELPATVVGDALRLRQVLGNLINNAIKFTSQGEITISVHPLWLDDRNATLRFEVSDTGEGISETDLPKLFKDFSQANSSTTRRFGGTGLGLAISKGIIEAMRGDIGVKSAPKEGSTFWFSLTLPVAAGVSGKEASPRDRIAPGGTRTLRVLLVEDNPINQRVARGMLEAALGKRLQLTIANDGFEGVQHVLAKPWDVVLMDCHMPVMDGLDATRCIREHEASVGGHTFVVALTANAFQEDRQRCTEAGMDDFLVKPIASDQLQRVLQLAASAQPDTLDSLKDGQSIRVNVCESEPQPL